MAGTKSVHPFLVGGLILAVLAPAGLWWWWSGDPSSMAAEFLPRGVDRSPPDLPAPAPPAGGDGAPLEWSPAIATVPFVERGRGLPSSDEGFLVHGRVIAPDSVPMHAITLHVSSASDPRSGWKTSPEADGRYAVLLPAPGTYSVDAAARQAALQAPQRIRLAEATPAVELDLRLESAHTLHVRLQDEWGQPAHTDGLRLIAATEGQRGPRRPESQEPPGWLFSGLPHGTQWALALEDPRFYIVEKIPVEAAQALEIPLTLLRPRAVSGRVQRRNGEPLAEALVEIEGERAKTAGDGSFHIPEVRPRRQPMIAIAASGDRSEVGAEIVQRTNEPQIDGVVITVDAAAVVEGFVLGKDGAPLEGVTVTLARRSQLPIQRTRFVPLRSRPRGGPERVQELELPGSLGGEAAWVLREGVVSRLAQIEASHELIVERMASVLALDDARQAMLRAPLPVASGAGGQRLEAWLAGGTARGEAHARHAELAQRLAEEVEAKDRIPESTLTALVLDSERKAKTSEEGRFRFAGVLPGRYRLTATKPGYLPLIRPLDFQIAGPALVHEHLLRLEPAASAALILKPDADLPLAGGALRAEIAWKRGDSSSSATYRGTGPHRVLGLERGRYDFTIWRSDGHVGLVPGIELERGEEQRVLVLLEPAARIQGRVLAPDGQPAAKTELGLEGPEPGRTTTIQTNESGEFAFTRLRSGSYELRVQAGSVKGAEVLSIEVARGAVIERTIRLPAVAKLEVAVHGVGPLVSGMVRLSLRRGEESLNAREVAPGLFEVRALPPGRYTAFARTQDLRHGLVHVFDLQGGALERIDLTLRPTSTILGRIDPPPPPGFAVTATSLEHPFLSRRGHTAPDGTFYIAGLYGGAYRVAADQRGGASVTVQCAPGSDPDPILLPGLPR